MTVDLPVEMAVLRLAQINADYANFLATEITENTEVFGQLSTDGGIWGKILLLTRALGIMAG